MRSRKYLKEQDRRPFPHLGFILSLVLHGVVLSIVGAFVGKTTVGLVSPGSIMVELVSVSSDTVNFSNNKVGSSIQSTALQDQKRVSKLVGAVEPVAPVTVPERQESRQDIGGKPTYESESPVSDGIDPVKPAGPVVTDVRPGSKPDAGEDPSEEEPEGASATRGEKGLTNNITTIAHVPNKFTDPGMVLSSDSVGGPPLSRLTTDSEDKAPCPNRPSCQPPLEEFYQEVRGRLKKAIRYPWLARLKRFEGTVRIGFLIESDGAVRNVHVAASSDYRMLDKAAVLIVKNISDFPPPPTGSDIKLVVPMRFTLDAD